MNSRAKLRFAASTLGMLLALVAVGCRNTNTTDPDVVRIDPNEVYARINDRMLVIDTRSKKEYDEGHVPDAKLVKLAEVDVQDEKPRFPGYKMIVVYGQNPGSGAAMAMAKRLIITQHKNVRLMNGGFEQWTHEGLPVEISRPGPSE